MWIGPSQSQTVDQIELVLEGCAKACVGRHVLEAEPGTFAIVAFGYAGDTGVLEAWIGLIFGMSGWFYIRKGIFLKAARKPVSAGMFWRLLLGTIAMLAFGYAGDTGVLEAGIGLILDWAAGSASARGSSRAKPEMWLACAPRLSGMSQAVWPQVLPGVEEGFQAWQLRTSGTCASTWCKCTSSPMSTGMWIGPSRPNEDDQIQVNLEGCAKDHVGMHFLEHVAQNYRLLTFGLAGETGVLEAWIGVICGMDG